MSWPDDVRRLDLRIDYYRGSGKGGQKRNKTSSACRITHIPTGHSASAERSRSQAENRRTAFRSLAATLIALMRAAQNAPERTIATERVRTYNQRRDLVTDVRSKELVWSYRDVLDGDGLDDIVRRLSQIESPSEV
jgi:peptide chain release factor 1